MSNPYNATLYWRCAINCAAPARKCRYATEFFCKMHYSNLETLSIADRKSEMRRVLIFTGYDNALSRGMKTENARA